MTYDHRRAALRLAQLGTGLLATGWLHAASADPDPLAATKLATPKGQRIEALLSTGGRAAMLGPSTSAQPAGPWSTQDHGPRRNTFVNDPCLDPPPPIRERTVQSETEIAVLNAPWSMGRKMVVGYNDSWGFYDNTQGLSGFSYSSDGGNTWIDGGGLPPRFPTGLPPTDPGNDGFFGDPVVTVDHTTGTFYYSSIYKSIGGYFTLSVSRGHFEVAPPQGVESVASTRCLQDPSWTGVPKPPPSGRERIVWEPPVEAVPPQYLGPDVADFLDKEWIHVDQRTCPLYLTYTRFTPAGETPIELVRSYDGGRTWTPPTVMVPNLLDTFNQATMPTTTPSGRVIVTYFSRTFDLATVQEVSQRIEAVHSDDDGETFSAPVTVAEVDPQGEPPGYNRQREIIVNAPFIAVDNGADDGIDERWERSRPGFGNVYITYFSGKSRAEDPPYEPVADIHVSTSTDDGTTFEYPVRVNDDATPTSHVFPVVQVNRQGEVFAGWIDRRRDPLANVLNDTWAAVSEDRGRSFGPNKLQSDVSTSWFVRADARPNFGDYNSIELLGFQHPVLTWADGRFPPPGGEIATPDTIFTVVQGLCEWR